MNQKRNLISLIILVCSFKIFSSCEADKIFLKDSETGRKMKREISFEQFKREIGQPHFSNQLSLPLSEMAKDLSDFEIDTTTVNVLETNYLVYTIKLNPKFITEVNKVFNLIVYKDNTNEIVKQIIEIVPTSAIENFDYQSLYDFLQSASKAIIYSSKGVKDSFCTDVFMEEVCYCYGHPYWLCNGCDEGFHWVTRVVAAPCSILGGNEPTGGDSPGEGANIELDPVLPTTNRDNCFDLKTKSNNPEFKNNMYQLRADANGTTGEKAFITFSGTPKFSPKYSASADDPNGMQMPNPYPTRTDCTGFMHCHMNDPALKNFAIFTPNDFIAQNYLIENSTAPVSSLTMYVTSQIQGVTSTFAIKITDIERFNVMVAIMEAAPMKYANIWSREIDEKNTPDVQVNNFLKQMQNAGFDGFELYKSDENFENWEQQKLNNSGNTVKIKC